jgi:RNA polymerase primary sigma factor
MASKTQMMPTKEDLPEKVETSPDRPLLDLSDAGVEKVIRIAKKRGYITHDQINSVLNSESVNSEQMEDVLAMFSETGINVVEAAEAEPDEERRPPAARAKSPSPSASRPAARP